MLTWLLLIPIVGLSGDDTRDRPPADALRFTARAVKSAVELGESVPIELMFANDGKKPLSINLHAAARCTCDFKCYWGGGQAGPTSPADEQAAKPDQWRRLAPGESFSVRVVHSRVGTQAIGKVELKFQYRPAAGSSPPNDWYEGVRESNSLTIQVADPAIVRTLKAEPADSEKVRAAVLSMLESLEAEGPYRGSDSIREIEKSAGALLVKPLAMIAADRSVRVPLRAKAVAVLGTSVYYDGSDQRPQLREIAVPALQALISDDAPDVRRSAVNGLGTADRDRPHLEKFNELFDDPDEAVRKAAADYLTWFMRHKETWPYVERALQNDSAAVRDVIVKARTLKFPASRADVELLLRCCLTADDARCETLLAGMERSVSARDLATLSELFTKRSAAVQVKVIELAGRTTGSGRVPLLTQALASERLEVRKVALDVIERDRDDSFAAALREFVAKAPDAERDRGQRILNQLSQGFTFPDVKKLMAEILPPSKPRPPADQIIQKAVRSAGRDTESVNLLFLIDDPEAVEHFRPLLDSPLEMLRAAACKYLGRVRDEASFEKIVQLTNDPSKMVRRTAAQALAAYGRARAALALFRLLDDQESEVRDAARYLLPSTAGGLTVDDLRRVFIREGNGNAWAVQAEPLKNRAAQRGPVAVSVLIELLDPPEGIAFGPAVIEALNQAADHSIEGNYNDPAERKQLAARWRDWWKTATNAPIPVQAAEESAQRGGRFVIELPPQRDDNAGLVVRYSMSIAGDLAPRVVPVSDEGVDEFYQYAIFQDGREVERGDVADELAFHRYGSIPFGSIASVGGRSGFQLSMIPRVKPGQYEVQIEARFLCTERIGGVPIRDRIGPPHHETEAKVITLPSNRQSFTWHGIGENIPLETAKRRSNVKEPKSIEDLVAAATAEPGSQGWSWFSSRDALEALDGRLGPEHNEYTDALTAELAGRLIARRDRFTMRGGESLWGAYRAAFLLGCLGDKKAIGVLEQARLAGDPKDDLNRCQCVLLRWYATAALKLIDVQNRPGAERTELAKTWLRHCFSSTEEHFMARCRLIPFLNNSLDPHDRSDFYNDLIPTLKDPWMIHDAKRFANQGDK